MSLITNPIEKIQMYLVIKKYREDGYSWDAASKKAGYGNRSAYYALRDKLIEDGLVDEHGELTDKARNRLAGADESPGVEADDEDEEKDPGVQEDPFTQEGDGRNLEGRRTATDGGTATAPAIDADEKKPTAPLRGREHRYQVALSETVRACLEAEAKTEHIKASQKISMILTEYYRGKNKIKE
jgi:hypothetical protein